MYPTGCLSISCLLILLKLSFSSLVYHAQQVQLSKLNNLTIHLYVTMSYSNLPVDSAHNLGVILYKNLSFAQYMLPKSCFHNISDLRRIRNTKLYCMHYCYFSHSLSNWYIVTLCYTTNHLQLVLNSAARAVTKTLHWLKIYETNKYLSLSLSHINLSN